jgi:hypothetical protein
MATFFQEKLKEEKKIKELVLAYAKIDGFVPQNPKQFSIHSNNLRIKKWVAMAEAAMNILC